MFQGLGNLQAFQEQVKNISILSKDVAVPAITPANVTDDTTQYVNSTTSYPVNQSVRLFDVTSSPTTEPSLLTDTVITGDENASAIVIQSKFPPQDITNSVMENPAVSLTGK